MTYRVRHSPANPSLGRNACVCSTRRRRAVLLSLGALRRAAGANRTDGRGPSVDFERENAVLLAARRATSSRQRRPRIRTTNNLVVTVTDLAGAASKTAFSLEINRWSSSISSIRRQRAGGRQGSRTRATSACRADGRHSSRERGRWRVTDSVTSCDHHGAIFLMTARVVSHIRANYDDNRWSRRTNSAYFCVLRNFGRIVSRLLACLEVHP